MKTAAFFDLDKTLIPLSTEKRFVQQLYKQNLVDIRQLVGVLLAYLKYKRLTQAEYSAMKKKIIRDLLQGKNKSHISAVAEQVFLEVFAPAIYPEALATIAAHRADGREVYIVSATIDAVAALFAEFVGATGFHATSLEIAEGIFTGNVFGEVCYGRMKADIIRNIAERDNIDLSQSHAYGDSYEDRYMLAAVGCPVAVNPDKRLASWAGERGWTLARWGKQRG